MTDLDIIREIENHLFQALQVVDAHWLQIDPTIRQLTKEAHDTVLSEVSRLRKEELKGRL